MRRIAVAAFMIFALVGLVWGTLGAETIITSGGSVLTGTIETGLPAAVSITSETGDVFTVQRDNMKHVRFAEQLQVTVETFDGNIIVGTLGGISDVFGLQTEGGDVQSISVGSIVEIRFEPPVVEVPTTAAPVSPATPAAPVGSPAVRVRSVVEAYEGRSGSFTLGLDSGLHLGFTSLNGFDIPRFTVGVNAILFGAVGRMYFPPRVDRVERTAERLASEGTNEAESLLEATQAAATPFVLPYVQLGTDAITIPHAGGGVLLRMGRAFYIDLGATIDTIGVVWPSIGLLIFF